MIPQSPHDGWTPQPQVQKQADVLNMDYINELPQPFVAHLYGGSEWPAQDIEVQTGLVRIDVCGKLEIKHIRDVKFFCDADGKEHDSDSFYAECDHDWHMQDDSFDHEYGCEVIRYWLCDKCGATKPTCAADFGDPEP